MHGVRFVLAVGVQRIIAPARAAIKLSAIASNSSANSINEIFAYITSVPLASN